MPWAGARRSPERPTPEVTLANALSKCLNGGWDVFARVRFRRSARCADGSHDRWIGLDREELLPKLLPQTGRFAFESSGTAPCTEGPSATGPGTLLGGPSAGRSPRSGRAGSSGLTRATIWPVGGRQGCDLRGCGRGGLFGVTNRAHRSCGGRSSPPATRSRGGSCRGCGSRGRGVGGVRRSRCRFGAAARGSVGGEVAQELGPPLAQGPAKAGDLGDRAGGEGRQTGAAMDVPVARSGAW